MQLATAGFRGPLCDGLAHVCVTGGQNSTNRVVAASPRCCHRHGAEPAPSAGKLEGDGGAVGSRSKAHLRIREQTNVCAPKEAEH